MAKSSKWFGLVLGICLAMQSAVVSASAMPASEKKFVKIPTGSSLYIDYIAAAPGKKTLVILNGLTYATDSWDKLMPYLVNQGYGILRYDPSGMGKTLVKAGAPTAAFGVDHQAQELDQLLDVLHVQGRVNLLGLSYGGGLALVYAAHRPDRVEHLIVMAPYTEPLAFQDQWIKNQITMVRMSQPWNPSTDDELYDFFLKQLVYSTYPTAEPAGIRGPWSLEAIFRMVQGIRKMDIRKIVSYLPAGSVDLVVAGKDQYIGRQVMDDFWDVVPAQTRSSRMVLEGSEHKIPEAKPRFAGAWVNLIMNNDSRIRNGVDFDGIPEQGVARSEKVSIPMPKE